MQGLFEKYGIEKYEFFPACNTEDNKVLQVHEKFPHLELPYIACSESHARVWDLISALPDGQWGLVLEDDVFFHKEWRSLLDRAVNQLPSDWDLFMLDCFYLGGWDFTSDGNCGSPGIHEATACSFADAYAITPTACKWLLKRRSEAIAQGEWLNNETLLMELQENGKSFTIIPKLALQHFDESDIQNNAITAGMASFYQNPYFLHFPQPLYDYDKPSSIPASLK